MSKKAKSGLLFQCKEAKANGSMPMEKKKAEANENNVLNMQASPLNTGNTPAPCIEFFVVR